MIKLFPRVRAYALAGEASAFMIAAAIWHDKGAWSTAALVFIVLSLMVWIGLSVYAALMHHRLLMTLYVQRRPDLFVQIYEPFLGVRHLRKNVRFSLLAYLSNGYAAAGDFEKAMTLLQEAEALMGGAAVKAKALLAGNRASILLAMKDTLGAEIQCGILEELAAKASKRTRSMWMEISAVLRAEICAVKGVASAAQSDLLREQMKKAVSALRRDELSFYLGLSYYSRQEAELGAFYLKRAAESGTLWFSACASALLQGEARDA